MAAKRKRGRAPAPDPPNPNGEPWERRDRESLQAFAAFRAYLEAGDTRSISRVAKELGKSASLLSRWSTRWDWQVRMAAWDEHEARARADTYLDEITARTKRHAEIARLHGEALALPARELLRRLKTNPDLLQHLPMPALLAASSQAARAYSRTVLTERLSLGISTENIGGHDGGPLTPARERAAAMSEDDLEALMLGAGIDAYLSGREDEAKAREGQDAG